MGFKWAWLENNWLNLLPAFIYLGHCSSNGITSIELVAECQNGIQAQYGLVELGFAH